MNKRKISIKKKRNLIAFGIFFIGLIFLTYPMITRLLAKYNQTTVINAYRNEINNISPEQLDKQRDLINKYNEELNTDTINSTGVSYVDFINPGDVIGYIQIPKINVELPIYQGTSSTVLRLGIGHLERTSLPSGIETAHIALTGHTGLPSAKLFTDLDKLEENDLFYITMLDRIYKYKVDQIKVVMPSDASDLKIEDGNNYTTLITCTPYMINTYRLLVRGVLVEEKDIKDIDAGYLQPKDEIDKKSDENKTIDNKSNENGIADNIVNENKTAENKTVDNTEVENNTSNTQINNEKIDENISNTNIVDDSKNTDTNSTDNNNISNDSGSRITQAFISIVKEIEYIDLPIILMFLIFIGIIGAVLHGIIFKNKEEKDLEKIDEIKKEDLEDEISKEDFIDENIKEEDFNENSLNNDDISFDELENIYDDNEKTKAKVSKKLPEESKDKKVKETKAKKAEKSKSVSKNAKEKKQVTKEKNSSKKKTTKNNKTKKDSKDKK